jgi:hypothetical protein
MTRLLEAAIARARELTEAEQDRLAAAVFAHLAEDERQSLNANQAEEVKRIQRDLRAGRTRLATDEEVQATWRELGL